MGVDDVESVSACLLTNDVIDLSFDSGGHFGRECGS